MVNLVDLEEYVVVKYLLRSGIFSVETKLKGILRDANGIGKNE